ncbi:MAG: TIGR03960 family B12-binding radical SAM protein [Candidatus Omnitrophica bacterium]|nr:TIGR03960 family B12-binding radical SAM protein [Candidatus Omnitrophota bacterium]
MNIDKLNELLLTVQKPGRYVGGEWNVARKEWTDDKVKVLLAFPDAYEVGMSYLGIKILYGILNNRSDCLCERVFSPWIDFEEVLRKNHISLFSLESRKPIKEFDIIGISLAYELCYTNVLNLLDLGGIPLRSAERTDSDPLVIAGGPSCYNPEPMAEFIDAFLIGDGEDAISEIVDIYKKLRLSGNRSRKDVLREMANIKGVYVPFLYRVDYNEDGTIESFEPCEKGIPEKIEKRIVRDLDKAFYPVDQIVPNIGIIHDRAAIEIMRGCKHACKFCQATIAYRPVRERSRNTILELAKKTHSSTGYDEISLLSLSSVDHSELHDTIRDLNKEFCRNAVSLSIPSLRIEDSLKDLPALISEIKKTGLTFAPEAGSDSLRKSLNKNIKIERLFEAASESFRKGWRKVKLYFMIGLPGETEEDLAGITDLMRKISNLKKEIDGHPAQITASINAFVPKPHTFFERSAMADVESLEKKREILRSGFRSKLIDLDFHSFNRSYLEAILTRGDRRLANVIYESWRSGARFDGWQELFRFETWLSSLKELGIDGSFYALRARKENELLPWDFIEI